MRILGSLFIAVGLGWIILTQLAAALPKSGNYARRLQALPVQESYSRQQVRDMIWEISASQWYIPEQETYTRQQIERFLLTASMNRGSMSDYPSPPLFFPVVLLAIGAFVLGVGVGSRDSKSMALKDS
jgi:hypothetical protein